MKTWKDITLRQFNKIQDLLQEIDEYTTLNIIDVLYNVDSANMPAMEVMNKYAHSLDFLMTTIPTNEKLKETYTINQREYNSNINLTQMTTAQFVDYQNYTKENPVDISKCLSVFVIPKGHTYNDGYDLKQVQDDIKDLDMVTINTLAFFFKKLYLLLLETTLLCLTQETTQMNIPTQKKEEILNQLKQIDLASLASSPTSSLFANLPTIH